MTFWETALGIFLLRNTPKRARVVDASRTVIATADELARDMKEFAECDCIEHVRKALGRATRRK